MRSRILEVASTLFHRYGFKRTSMETLARDAGVAKPTLYAYFADKDAIFRAVVKAVCEDMLEATERASRSRAPVEERLAAMLSAKFTRYWELVQASPHALELIDSQNALARDAIQRFDRSYLKLLVATLDAAKDIDARQVGLSSTAATQMLVRAASGAAYDATSGATHRRHLAEIARTLVAGMRL